MTSTFTLGQTILLKVTGDTQGGTDDTIAGQLLYNGAITTTLGATQGNWLDLHGGLFPSDGDTYAFNQVDDGVLPQPEPANNRSTLRLSPCLPTRSANRW